MAYDAYFDNDKILERWNKEKIKNSQQETKKEENNNKHTQRRASQETEDILKNARKNSVKGEAKDFFSYFKLVPIKILAGALAVMIAGSSVLVTLGAGLLKDRIKEITLEDEIDDYIVHMISPEKEYGDIMSYSAYRVGADNFAYDTNLLAKDFAKCDAELFDLLIYNAYENAQYNSDKNINSIFQELSILMPQLQIENPELYYKLEGIDSFYDYLVAKKCVDEKGEPDYEKYKEFGQNLYEYYRTYLKNTYGGKSK